MDTLPEQFEEDFMVNYRELGLLLQRPERHLQYQLMPGSAVIFDNWRILHARQAFTGKRRIAGCYIRTPFFLCVCVCVCVCSTRRVSAFLSL